MPWPNRSHFQPLIPTRLPSQPTLHHPAIPELLSTAAETIFTTLLADNKACCYPAFTDLQFAPSLLPFVCHLHEKPQYCSWAHSRRRMFAEIVIVIFQFENKEEPERKVAKLGLCVTLSVSLFFLASIRFILRPYQVNYHKQINRLKNQTLNNHTKSRYTF